MATKAQLEMALYREAIERLQRDIERLQRSNRRLRQRLSAASEELRTLQTSLAQAHEVITQLGDDLLQTNAGWMERLEAGAVETAALSDENSRLQAQVDEFASDLQIEVDLNLGLNEKVEEESERREFFEHLVTEMIWAAHENGVPAL